MNKQYKKLYSRDVLGNVRVWWVEQKNEQYRVCSGIDGGQIVVSDYTTCEVKNLGKKNETTGEQQATKECESLIKKKLKTKYFEDIKDVDNPSYIKPILAESYKDYSHKVIFEDGEWGAQTKFNGICCVATKDGCFSRKGEKFLSVKHVEKVLKPFFEKHPNSFLHGELFNDDYREKLNEIVKLCRKTVNISNEDISKSEELIQFYIYDGCIMEVGLDQSKPYVERKKWIDSNVIAKYEYCAKVETTIIKNKPHLDTLFSKAIERGDEGLILRNMNMKYVHKRNSNLLKYKPMDSDEMRILEINEGKGNWAGKAKKISVITKNGEVFEATFKGDMTDAQTFLKDSKKWIGKVVTIKYFGFTGLGCPQYAQFDYQNCLRAD